MTSKSKRRKSEEAVQTESSGEAEINQSELHQVVASIILERLKKQDVLWVRIADPSASMVEHLQIASSKRIDAYLVRWSTWADSLRLIDLTEDIDDKPNFVKQLADGWLTLKNQYRLPVHVHLVTNDVPSAKKFKGAKRNDCHLAKFLATEWKQHSAESEDWSEIWQAVEEASHLQKKPFEEFVQHCRFDCTFAIPQHDEDQGEQQPFFWIKHIQQRLFEHEAAGDYPIELNHAKLLQILGWRGEYAETFATTNEKDSQAEERPEPVNAAPAMATVEGLNKVSPGADQHVSTETDITNEETSIKTLSAFVGKKLDKERFSWKELAGRERQTPGLVPSHLSEAESAANKKAWQDKLKGTGKLRKLMSSQEMEPEPVSDETEEGTTESWQENTQDFDDTEYSDARLEDPAIVTARTDSPGVDGNEENEPVQAEPEIAEWLRPKKETREHCNDEIGNDREWTDESPSQIERETTDDAQFPDSESQEGEHEHPEPEIGEAEKTNIESAVRRAPSKYQPPVKLVENVETESQEEGELNEFTSVGRLAKRQTFQEIDHETANHDAFMWYFNNGNELFDEGRFEDAEPEYIRALEIYGTLDEPSAEREFLMLENLGDIYLFLDKPAQAVELYERTKEMRFTSKIPASKYIAALIKLGGIYEEDNRFDAAEKQYRKAVEVAAETLPKDDPLLQRLNVACLDLARNRATLLSRFSATEFERIREMMKGESDVALIHRKKRTTEADIEQLDIWKGGSRPEDLEAPKPPSSRNTWLLAAAAVIVFFVFGYALLVPRSGAPVVTSGGDQIVGTYSSTDGRKSIELQSGGRATFSNDGDNKDATFRFVGASIQDLIPLVPGHLRTDNVFFNAIDSAIVESTGTHLYAENAPETVLVKQMWKYATLAEGYRHEKHFYPESDDAWQHVKEKTIYVNPFTKTSDAATICSESGEATDTPVRATIAGGDHWQTEPKPHPGGIVLNVYNGRLLFIRAYDRSGNWLSSADPKKCFYIELADGSDITREKLQQIRHKALAESKKQEKKLRFIFASSPEVETRLAMMQSSVPGALFFMTLVAYALWRRKVLKRESGPLDIAFCAITTVLLLAWYAVGLLDIG